MTRPQGTGKMGVEHSVRKGMREPLPFPGQSGQDVHLRLFSRRKKCTGCTGFLRRNRLQPEKGKGSGPSPGKNQKSRIVEE